MRISPTESKDYSAYILLIPTDTCKRKTAQNCQSRRYGAVFLSSFLRKIYQTVRKAR